MCRINELIFKTLNFSRSILNNILIIEYEDDLDDATHKRSNKTHSVYNKPEIEAFLKLTIRSKSGIELAMIY